MEPLLALSGTATGPLDQLFQEYVYERLFKQLAAEHAVNVSSTVSGDTDCSQHNISSSNDASYELVAEAQSAASTYLIYLVLASTVPATIITPFMAAYSDKEGRKYALIPPAMGITLRVLVFLLVVILELPLWCLVIGNLAQGILGDYIMITNSCCAYVSDTVSKDTRTFRLTVLISCMLLPTILTPVINGLLVGSFGYLYPLAAVLFLEILSLLYMVFFVPEIIRRSPSVPRTKFWSLSHVTDTLSVFLAERKGRNTGRKWKMCFLLVGVTAAYGLRIVHSVLMTLFQLNRPLCWNSVLVGVYLSLVTALAGLAQLAVLRLLKRCCSDLTISLIGACCYVIECVYTGLIRTTAMMFLGGYRRFSSSFFLA